MVYNIGMSQLTADKARQIEQLIDDYVTSMMEKDEAKARAIIIDMQKLTGADTIDKLTDILENLKKPVGYTPAVYFVTKEEREEILLDNITVFFLLEKLPVSGQDLLNLKFWTHKEDLSLGWFKLKGETPENMTCLYGINVN